ncbi:hypothetical protein COCC4DRAFT_123434 [Bipolaris maydis ATCC 48331]|uniref:Uncharacterized protein n=1 Tax=Cochliobolus heterostrophus (strain C4 / ATCC 48331 / race T) TaxID=665024 RepID=N4XHE5_COCH4|nr:uncharacterized protein COCC4DRAFT_123434 [Bipolaris maydis ATCC 48331]ENI11145.1 hypothetical protein COCC4DRAFT_123434 [Bipolaris maydis ATCC 48331]
MPRNGDGSSDNGPIEGHEILHGTTGDDSLQHTKHVAPMPEGEKGDSMFPTPIHPLQQHKRTHSNASTYTKLTHHHHSPPRILRRRHHSPNIHLHLLPLGLQKTLGTSPRLPLPNLAHPAKTLQTRLRRSRHRGCDFAR